MPPLRVHGQRGVQRRGAADRVEHEVGAAPAGQPAHLQRARRSRRSIVCVAPNCRAISSGTGRRSIGDDLIAAGDRRALHDVQADAAGADHGDARAARHLRGVGHRADAGDHRAADRRQRVEGHVVRHRDRAGLGDDHEVGEAGGAEKRRDVLAARMDPRGARGQLVAKGDLLDAGRTAPRALRGTAGTRRTPAPSRARRDRPAACRVTAAPTSRTMPAPSCPSTSGVFAGQSPRAGCRSLWQTPAAFISTSTSPGPGPSSSAASTESGVLCSHRIAAVMSIGSPTRVADAATNASCVLLSGRLCQLAATAANRSSRRSEDQGFFSLGMV